MFSCKDKDSCSAGDLPSEMIVGTWELKSVYNPFVNETTYPGQEGYTVTITFKENNTYQLKDSREPDTETGSYKVRTDRQESCSADKCIDIFSDASSYSITCNELIHDITPVDGPLNTYVRQ